MELIALQRQAEVAESNLPEIILSLNHSNAAVPAQALAVMWSCVSAAHCSAGWSCKEEQPAFTAVFLRSREKRFMCLCVCVCAYLSTLVAFSVSPYTVCVYKVFSLGTWHIKELSVTQRHTSSWRHEKINKYRFPSLDTFDRDNWTIIDCMTGNENPWIQKKQPWEA